MAAKLKSANYFRFSPLIFKNEDNFAPIRFFCTTVNDDIKSLILKGGGFSVDNAEDADILLCEKRTDPKIFDGYLPYDFIVDCVMKDTFLAVDKYRENLLGLRDHSKSKDSNVDPDLGPIESSRVRISKEDLTGRKKYTLAEDLNIIKYLVTNGLCSQTGGNVVWKQMELYKVTPHTFQSMKARFKLIMSRLHLYNVPNDWIVKLEGSCSTESKSGHSSDDETSSFSEVDEWKNIESKSGRNKKDKQKFESSTNDRGNTAEAEDIESIEDELFTTDISPIRDLERVNDSHSSESHTSVTVPCTLDPNDSTLFVHDRLTSVSPGQYTQQDDSTPSGCDAPTRMSPRHKKHLDESSASECNTPAKRSTRQKINLNNSSTPECNTPTRGTTRHKKHLESPSSSVSQVYSTTRQSEVQTRLCAAGSSGQNTSRGKEQLKDSSPADQSKAPSELHLNYPDSASTLRLSFEKNQSDSEDQESDNLSAVVDFVHEGIMPRPSSTQPQGCNCEAGECDRVVERKVQILTKTLHVETVEALYLLKAFDGNLRRIIEFSQCKK